MRRSAVSLLVPLLALGWLASARAAQPLTLSDGRIALEAEPEHGSILGVRDLLTGIELAPSESLADSFRLLVRAPNGEMATILGRDQAVSGLRRSATSLSIRWRTPLRDASGAEHNIAIRMDMVAEGGALTFTLQAANHGPDTLVEARYPLLGGLTGLHAPGKACDASLWIPTTNPWEKPLAPGFGNAAFGYPGQMNMSLACVRGGSAGRSLYFASQDPIARHKRYRFEEEGSDVSASIEHLPHTPPGGTFEGSPVVVRFVDGDWRGAGEAYREWFLEEFGVAPIERDWIRRQSFFLMTMFMLPEGTINYTFRDIPAWARSAKEHGVNAVQISGWQQGGHDNGYPDYTPDPRLGTWEELEAGIRACHAMGLKVYFFVNYQPMMVESDWYKNDLIRYREMGPDGGLTWLAGWGMGTLWARAGHPKLMTWGDPAFPEFRKVIVDQFARLAEIGGDGVHVDKMFPSALEFNPDAPMGVDTATWEGSILLSREVMRECRKRNPDWAMSFECNWDRLLEFGGATWWVGNQLITRQVFPEHAETLGLYQAYDRLGVNNAVRDGHIVMVAPLNFSRSMDWEPWQGLSDYIKEVKRIRDDLQETVFLGEVLGTGGASVEGERLDGVQWNAYRNRSTGRRACILTNARMEDRTVTVRALGDTDALGVRIHVPFERPREVRLPAELTIPAEGIAFIEEIGGAR